MRAGSAQGGQLSETGVNTLWYVSFTRHRCNNIEAYRTAARIASRSMSQAAPEMTAETSQAVPPPESLHPQSREDWRKKDSALVQHLNDVFSPLQFPPELASRILTHGSHPDARVRHNGRLSFVGESHFCTGSPPVFFPPAHAHNDRLS